MCVCNDCERQGAGSGCEPCAHKRVATFEGKRIEACPHKPPTVDGVPIDILGIEPRPPRSAREAVDRIVIDEGDVIDVALKKLGDSRLAFVGALYAKAETSYLKRIDALLILQATLAEMLVPAIEGLKMERDAIEPGSIPRHNADLMIEIAEELRAEALRIVDHHMANSRLVVVPR